MGGPGAGGRTAAPAPALPRGGTGRTHNWDLSRRIRDALFPKPLWLAGGLRSCNEAQAIRVVQPFGVDLCTGVRSHGQLDAAKLAAFRQAVHSA